ncbi:hypothetical protein LTT66_22360 [Nocardia gipuzkoensis]|uniref:hypothetical protein n=1 Tax=Nocardia gipuzkoensis TaxID=2749991 RepID=UPI001E5FE266|nr:hypothetical protein [Nocardia gipuzkoensis]UGT66047.1 hypothetical protein LTT66_22360 [Nocardia gipuzkoensis]
MKKTVTGLLMGALVTGALIASAPAAQATVYPTEKECLAAAKQEEKRRNAAGDINVPDYSCKRVGNGWRVGIFR